MLNKVIDWLTQKAEALLPYCMLYYTSRRVLKSRGGLGTEAIV